MAKRRHRGIKIAKQSPLSSRLWYPSFQLASQILIPILLSLRSTQYQLPFLSLNLDDGCSQVTSLTLTNNIPSAPLSKSQKEKKGVAAVASFTTNCPNAPRLLN
ncbi:hypothetical protein N431DRAFT_436260 [Stipitochalara longipes BDJ]|nr:hypothetical protein N431DRAFT_436260 [Stipitochalara longipes BDJ]